jgi:hypothetical protein
MKATFKGEVIVLWLVILLAACAPAPIVDSEVLSLFAGESANVSARPLFVAVQNGTAIAARPITNGGGPVVGWGVTCVTGPCPAVPGTFLTAAALSQWFNELAAAGWQIYSKASAVVRVPLAVPLTPAMFEQAQMEMD